MRILSARIFSKSFGGKIKPGQTDVNKETTFPKKNLHNKHCESRLNLLLNNGKVVLLC